MGRHYRIVAPLVATLALAGCTDEPSAPQESADERLVRRQAEQFLQVMEAKQDAKA